ncbi:hypothetical protein SNEBB_000611 [Seison nebaliae]|nr:hypothetical protein SNEBB_000611 [Seison nebaliae]
MHNELQIGFLENSEEFVDLNRIYFPTKFGGFPSWLHPEYVPQFGCESLKCNNCGKVRRFLLQINCCMETREAYYMMYYVFICLTASCWRDENVRNNDQDNGSSLIVCLRGILPQVNEFYKYDENQPEMIDEELIDDIEGRFFHELSSSEQEKIPAVLKRVPRKRMCVLCGVFEQTTELFCSTEHKSYYRRFHPHRNEEQMNQTYYDETINEMLSKFTFPPTAISLTDENGNNIKSDFVDEAAKGDDEESSDEDENVFLQEQIDRHNNDPSDDEEDDNEDQTELVEDNELYSNDFTFNSFMLQIRNTPNQILRIGGDEPIWVFDSNKLENIPNCVRCGGSRHYIFQILPQLINSINFEENASIVGVDWGTVVICVCTNRTCPMREKNSFSSFYSHEYVFIQYPPSPIQQ